MAIEQFANLAEDELASGYTSGGSAIEVDDATGFPTSGTFRVALGNADRTIFRVDSVSGTTFTGGAEEFDANASAGDTVTLVGTRGSAERFLQSPESGKIGAPSGVSGADLYGPGLIKIVPVVGANFSWLNQGGASVTDANNISYLVAPSGAGNNFRARTLSTSGSTWKYRSLLRAFNRRVDFNSFGMLLRESGTSKIMIFHHLASATVPGIYVSNSTGVTNITTHRATFANWSLQEWWMEIERTASNLVFRLSVDGVNFQQILSQTTTTDFTTAPDEIGYFLNNNAVGSDIAGSVLSWEKVS